MDSGSRYNRLLWGGGESSAATGTERSMTVPIRANSLHSPTTRKFVLGLLLAIATVALYYPINHHQFVSYDDDIYITNNWHIKYGLSWKGVQWAFTAQYADNWHPLTWLSHGLDCQLFFLNSGRHHATNLLLHTTNALLLFWVLLRATGYSGRSFMVAALFALHPINVESVAWVAERKNLLSTLFFLLALAAYRWYAREPRVGRYATVALLFALGLMAKPQIITLPFVLLLWDYWPLRRMSAGADNAASESRRISARSFRWLVLEKLPLLFLVAASAVITLHAQRDATTPYPFSVRIANAIVSYAWYVRKAFWPSRLAILYPHAPGLPPIGQMVAALLFLLAVTALTIALRRQRYLLVGWLWFLGTLAPMIGLVQVGVQAVADRYAYLSFVGLFIMVCWGVADFHPKTGEAGASGPIRDGTAPKHPAPVALRAVSVVVLLVLAVLTSHQLGYWNENTALWVHTLQVTTGNFVAEDNLAMSLMEQGQREEAMKHFQTALSIYPSDPTSNLQIAAYDHQHGKLQEALARYTQMMSVARDNVSKSELLSNRGLVYHDLRDYAHARVDFETAVALNPRNSRAWLGLGVIAQKSGDLNLAIQDYGRSNEAKPSDITYLLLARALEQSGRKEEAQAAIEQAKLFTHNLDASRIVSDGLLAH